MTLTKIVTGMEKGPEAIEANFEALDVGPDLLHGKAENYGSGLNGYIGTGFFVRVPIDPQARTALLIYSISISNSANNLNLSPYQTIDVFKFSSSVMVNDNEEFDGGAATFENMAVNGWGTTHFESNLNGDGSISMHVGQDATVKDGGANCYGIKLIKY